MSCVNNKNIVKWKVESMDTPKVKKNCPKCGNSAIFINSGNFRVNANKNKLDVWLIYHCEKCKSTWNMTIYERISPKEIQEKEYQLFLRNDTHLARIYGFNVGLHNKNNVTLDYNHFTYNIVGKDVNILEQPIKPSSEICIEIASDFPTNLRVDKVLAMKLGVSREVIKKLYKASVISSEGHKNIIKEKVNNKIILTICPYLLK